jgi:general secretion pathway protein G
MFMKLPIKLKWIENFQPLCASGWFLLFLIQSSPDTLGYYTFIFFGLALAVVLKWVGLFLKDQARQINNISWIVLIGCLLLWAVSPRFGRSGEARFTVTLTQIAVFGTALDQYQIDTGSFPLGTNGLQALIQKPADATNWQGPYLNGVEIPMDPWQQPYIYRCPSKRAASGFPYDLISSGPPGADAPITNSERPSL